MKQSLGCGFKTHWSKLLPDLQNLCNYGKLKWITGHSPLTAKKYECNSFRSALGGYRLKASHNVQKYPSLLIRRRLISSNILSTMHSFWYLTKRERFKSPCEIEMRLDSLDTCVQLLLIIPDEIQHHSICIKMTKNVRFCLFICLW